MEQLTDSQLVALTCDGDSHAFGLLVERYQAVIKRIVARMIAHHEVARELEQEAFLQAYLSLHHLRDTSRFKGWLCGIALNVCRSYLRQPSIDTLSFEAFMGGTQGTPEDMLTLLVDTVDLQTIVEEEEMHQMVLKAVNDLSPKERVATFMFYYDQLSHEEIAASLAISITAVKGRLHRARKQLRERLAFVHEEQPGNAPIQRKKAMIKATISSIRKNLETGHDVVILQDETARTFLFIWIAEIDALTIAAALTNVEMPRPHAVHLMADTMKAAGVHLQEVHIETIKDQIFYGIIKIRQGEKEQELDARPSDALVLALLLNSPIYIAKDVIEAVGIIVPEGRKLKRFGDDGDAREQGRQHVTAKVQELFSGSHPRSPQTEEERAEAYQKFIDTMTEKEESP